MPSKLSAISKYVTSTESLPIGICLEVSKWKVFALVVGFGDCLRGFQFEELSFIQDCIKQNDYRWSHPKKIRPKENNSICGYWKFASGFFYFIEQITFIQPIADYELFMTNSFPDIQYPVSLRYAVNLSWFRSAWWAVHHVRDLTTPVICSPCSICRWHRFKLPVFTTNSSANTTVHKPVSVRVLLFFSDSCFSCQDKFRNFWNHPLALVP